VSRNPETFSSAAGHIQIYNIDIDALAVSPTAPPSPVPDGTKALLVNLVR
jgi:hypothetical protein